MIKVQISKLFQVLNYNQCLFGLVLIVCFFVSSGVRYQQFETWEKNPNVFFVGERPMMTTLDAPFWLRWAREYNEGIYGSDTLRLYPEKNKHFKTLHTPINFLDRSSQVSPSETSEIKFIEVPLISFLIANLTPFFNYNYYLTGTLMVPVLASLFIFPLGIYFFRIGVPLSGLFGGFIGTFASGYYMRSSIGRIDTDMLNLFFPSLAALLILEASRAKNENSVLLFSASTGGSLFLFEWWYGKPGLTMIYFLTLVLCLFIHKIRFRFVLISSFLFLLCADPSVFLHGVNYIQKFAQNYFSLSIEDAIPSPIGRLSSNQAIFPNALSTVSEISHVPMEETFRRILNNIALGWIGVIGFISMAVFKWRVLLPLVPMLAIGLLSFQSSNRFIMYLGPFIGMGLGWLFNIGIDWVFDYWMRLNVDKKEKKLASHKKHFKEHDLNGNQSHVSGSGWLRQVVLYGVMGLFFFLISEQTAISFVPGPSINTRLYATFLEVKKRVPEDSALLTWWDYGYAITDVTGLATFHDGGAQKSPKTYFVARGLISHEQEELYDITQFLATEGNLGISKNNTSPQDLLEAMRNPTRKPWNPIYLFFTADMTGKYGAISKLGSWDIVDGGSKPRGYQNLACNNITNEEMNCRGVKFDLKTGKINDRVALKRMVFIRDGNVLREQKFRHAQGYTLQLLVSGQRIVEVQLIDEVVFKSNYNQMFLLGRYRNDLYEETYNAFPFSRLFKVKF